MQQPKKQSWRKIRKGRMKGNECRSNVLSQGDYGLKIMQSARITARQIEAARRGIMRCMRRQGKCWIRMFTDIPVTAKPAEVRMGSGKGSIDRYVFRARAGRIAFEVSGVEEDIAVQALTLAAAKLPVRAKVVSRKWV